MIMNAYSGLPLFKEGGQIEKKIKRKKTKKKPRGWGKARYGKQSQYQTTNNETKK